MKESIEIFDELVFQRANKPFKRDKSKNTPEFHRKAAERRERAKIAKKSRKANRGK